MQLKIVTGTNGGNSMAVTIRDVARHAGVSVATVSRYLNNSPLIAQDSREKVRRSIEELRYEPNFLARNMLTKQSQSIAFVIEESSPETYGNENYLRIQYGVEQALAEHGYYLMIISVRQSDHFQSLKKVILENRIDGVILPVQMAGKSLVRFLREKQTPFVVIGRTDLGSWVDIDNVSGGRAAAEALLQTGARDVCFIGNGEEKVFVRERAEGFRAAAEASGANIAMRLDCPASAEAGREIGRGDKVHEGYVVSDNVTAFGLLQGLKEREIFVPGQVQVISFDDGIIAQLCAPKLTVVDIDVHQLGVWAAELLYQQLQSVAVSDQQRLLPVRLIRRASSR